MKDQHKYAIYITYYKKVRQFGRLSSPVLDHESYEYKI